MRFVRFRTEQGPRFGLLNGSSVRELEGDPIDGFATTERSYDLGSLSLLPPTQPSKVLAIGRNYLEHIREGGREVPEAPIVFLKAPSCLIGHGECIVLPIQSKQVSWEGELVVIFRKQARNIEPEEAGEYILGYTIGNDVSAKDLQFKDNQWMRAKSFDSFGPVGPWIETEIDPSDLKLETRVNGVVKQSARTSLMMHDIPSLVSYISKAITILPGDMLFTGTPGGVEPILKAGDVVEIEIEGIGTLRNPVVGQ